MQGNYFGQSYFGQGYAVSGSTTTQRDQIGKARISIATARAQTGKAAIKRTTQKAQTGKSRVSIITNISYQVDQSQTIGLGFAMGWSTGNQSWYQTFTPSVSKPLGKIDIMAGLGGTPSDNLQLKVYLDNAGSPGSLVETASNTITGSSISGTSGVGQLLSFLFGNTNVLNAGTTYGIEVSRTGAIDGSNFYYLFRRSSTDPDYTGGTLYENQSGAYVDTSRDMLFYQYWQSNPVTGKARITAAIGQTQAGQARVTRTVSRTQTGVANINITTTMTKNQLGMARILVTTSRSQTGMGRITVMTTRTQTGVSRISITTSRAVTGIARITALLSRPQTGVARLTVTTAKSQTGLMRIQTLVSKQQTGRARLTVSVLKPQTGVSFIIREKDYSWAAMNSLPTDANPLANAYSSSQITDTATEDASYIDASGTNRYLIHVFRNLMTGSETALTRKWVGRTTRPANVSTVYLQIYNFTSGAWETVDSDNTSTASPLSLAGTINANLPDYYDTNNITAWRVYQEVQ